MSGFEGSYMGANDRISPQAVMECKICWTPYEPVQGDDTRQVRPGTPFVDLPHDWSCPNCDAPKEQFLVQSDPGAEDVLTVARLKGATDALVADFTEIWNGKMRDVPLVNRTLRVEAVGFILHEGRPLGVLISPWFMNLVMLPADGEDWSDLRAGDTEVIGFPSGDYEFLHNTRETVGGYKACSLVSPMGEYTSQVQAVEVASAIMTALFDTANRAETDRREDIRAARELDIAETEAAETSLSVPGAAMEAKPTRREVILADVSRDGDD
ncbi:[NiFe]-hydrogenase assembly chaperone HybE [Tropicimonas marinistellae]|uniref:[NiFe]-hydrogenase assembly chaperone HybE n=1 Tax=Tropicimonas marinistellae TaxID=1739787 RepID=UPI0008350031|nr:[NiFe]-hydrogenase assembly chaperone HybE [Tropicimonas marinistellae]